MALGLSVQAPTRSHSHTHSVKASVPAGVAKLGPASLPPPVEGEGGEPFWLLQKQAAVGEAGSGKS